MSKILLQTKNELSNIIESALKLAFEKKLLIEVDIPKFTIETPADRSHGDFSTNIAMSSAKIFRIAPIKIAESICSCVDLSNSMFECCEIAGPGFINFFLNNKFYPAILKDIELLKDDYGRSNFGKNERVMIEFVSANPTGPMHMGNARGGALGDCLAAVMDAAGYDVYKEFYINDAGNQIDKFALSLDIRYQQIFKGVESVELPEDSYHGDDIKELAQQFALKYKDSYLYKDESTRRSALINFALPKNISKMKNDMSKYRIEYDNWFHESDLHKNGDVLDTINILRNKGLTYDEDGATWYKATNFGAEKDEVLIRKNGTPTYFAADIAYHRNKFATRGFERCIDIWGADHHGHVSRMQGAMNAIGLDGNKLNVVLMQLVKLVKNGEVVRMSKRTGKAIQLADLLDEVPIDSARFLFNMREPNTQMEFDLDLAIQQDSQNSVYYVQYAYARICSILKALNKENIIPRACTNEELKLLSKKEEIELIRHLSEYTSELINASQEYNPSIITRYVVDLATLFHKFYNSCRVKVEDEKLMQSRISLCIAVQTVIKNVLTMFKISCPDSM